MKNSLCTTVTSLDYDDIFFHVKPEVNTTAWGGPENNKLGGLLL